MSDELCPCDDPFSSFVDLITSQWYDAALGSVRNGGPVTAADIRRLALGALLFGIALAARHPEWTQAWYAREARFDASIHRELLESVVHDHPAAVSP